MRNHCPTPHALALVIGLVVCVPAVAQTASCPQIEPVNLSSLLLPPPCDTCDITKGELAELQALQQSRTPEIVQHASDDYTRTLERFLGGMNIPVKADSLGEAGALFKCVAKTTEDAVDKARLRFHRTRPYNLPDNGLKILKVVKADDAPSFPSGHAAFGMVAGMVLIEMVPELRDKFAARIEDFGFSRLISGVHFRSDVYAGEIAGAAIAASLFANSDFRTQFEKAKPELRKALGY
jgi:acid phosphatase (class A)